MLKKLNQVIFFQIVETDQPASRQRIQPIIINYYCLQ